LNNMIGNSWLACATRLAPEYAVSWRLESRVID
jgi:hypothetical protein